jgi:DNA topoisomerase-1
MVILATSARGSAGRTRARCAPSGAPEGAAPDVPAVPADPAAAARFAGLRYVSDLRPGIRRRRSGSGFAYTSPTGERIRDPERLRWLRALAIPPAWTDVWISPFTNGHILATGRDKRGRKQYRYHPSWRAVRDEAKYTRMIAFGELLPRIRRRIDRDLARRGMAREKVLAAVVRLLELTLIRVGNEEYARVNASFGLTTLRNRHVRVRGSQVRFRFRGKGGVQHEVGIRDRRLAALIGRLQDLPGQELFEYRDGLGRVHEVTSDDVNAYLRAVASPDISAKDFRTWAATVLAFRALCALDEAASQGEAKRNVVAVVKAVATQLGNTPAVCRKAYIHPAVLDAYVEGTLVEREAARIAADVAASGGGGQVAATPYARERAADADRPDAATRAAAALAATTPHGWADPAEERAVLEFLRRRVLLGPATARAAGSAA